MQIDNGCKSCDGKGRFIDTTYDRTGESVWCDKCHGTGLSETEFRALVKDAWNLRALTVKPAMMVKVKPLVWVEHESPHYTAPGFRTQYMILTINGVSRLGGFGDYLTVDLAKAAAQTDHDARILAAIDITSLILVDTALARKLK